MKKLENFLRRVLSMVLSICLVLGNVAPVLADDSSETVDLPKIISSGSEMTASYEYLGIRKVAYDSKIGQDNNNKPVTDPHYTAYYLVNLDVAGVADTIGFGLDHQLQVADNQAVSVTVRSGEYAGDITATFDKNNKAVLLENTANTPLSGKYTVLVAVPLKNDQVKQLMTGTTVTSRLQNLQVGDKVNYGSGSIDTVISLNPQATLNAEIKGDKGYVIWTLNYKCDGIQLSNTKIEAKIDKGEFIPWKGNNTETDLKAYVHGNSEAAVRAHETIKKDKQTITFDPVADTSCTSNCFDTDLTLVFYSSFDNGVNYDADVSMDLTIEPEKVVGPDNKMVLESATFEERPVSVRFVRSELGAEAPVAVSSFPTNWRAYITNGQDWGTFQGNLAAAEGATNEMKAAVVFKNFGGDAAYEYKIGVVTTHYGYGYMTYETVEYYADGDTIKLDVNNDGTVDEATESFVVSVGANGVIKLINSNNPIEKTGKVVSVNGEACIKWEIKIDPTTRFNERKMTDTLTGGSTLLVDQNHPVTVTGQQGTANSYNQVGNGLESSGSTISYTFKQEESCAGNEITMTYYTTLPVDETVQSDVPGYVKYVDASTISNSIALEGYTHPAVTPTGSATTYAVTVDLLQNGTPVDAPANGGRIYVGVVDKTVTPSAGKENAVPLLDQYPVAMQTVNGKLVGAVTIVNSGDGATDNAEVRLLVPNYNSNANQEGIVDKQSYYKGKGPDPYAPANLIDTYFTADTLNGYIYVEDGDGATGSDDFYQITARTDNSSDNTIKFTLTNDKNLGLQGMDEAYLSGHIYINTNKNEYTLSPTIATPGYGYEKTPFGIAGNFHLVGFKSITQNQHINGNILTPLLVSNHAGIGTNDYEEKIEVSYIQDWQVKYTSENNIFGTGANANTNNLLVLGDKVDLALYDNNKGVLTTTISNKPINRPANIMIDEDTQNKPFVDFELARQQVVDAQNELLKYSDRNYTMNIIGENGQPVSNPSIDLLTPSASAYLNMKGSEFKALPDNLLIDGFSSKEKGSMVFNIDCGGSDFQTGPGSINAVVDGEPGKFEEVTDFTHGRIVYNFHNCAGKTITLNKSMLGIIVAPGAKVVIAQSATINGSVYADEIEVNNESHRVSFQSAFSPAQANFSAVKHVDDSPEFKGTFSFYIQEMGNNSNKSEPSPAELADPSNNGIEIKSSNNSIVEFTQKKITEPGLYYFRIGEVIPEEKGTYEYDTTLYYIKVNASKIENAAGSMITLDYNFTKGSPDGESVSGPAAFVFNNKTIGGLTVVKKDSETKTPLSGAKFTLTGNNYNEEKTTGIDGQVSFGNLVSGTYTLTETEAPAGYVKSEPSTWTVTVSEGKITGVSDVTLEYDGDTAIATIYNDKEEVETTEVTVTKNWENVPTGVTAPDIQVQLLANGEIKETITLPVNGKLTHTWTELPTVDEIGTPITYTVKEITTDNEDKPLAALADYQIGTPVSTETNVFEITNTYVAPTKAELEATKTLTGADLKAEQFEFVLTPKNGAPMPKDDNGEALTSLTAKNAADGNVKFSEIPYTLADLDGETEKTFIYVIRENPGESGKGFTYDSKTHEVSVTLKLVGSELVAEASTAAANGKPVFVNTYTAAPTSVVIPVKKQLDVPTGLTGPEDTVGKFEFKLEAITEGAPMPAAGGDVVSGPGANGANVYFGAIKYTDEGTYEYNVTETKGNMPGITYDEHKSKVTVNVSRDENGKLIATITGEGGNAAKFTNEYNVTPVTAQIPVQKVLENELDRKELPSIDGKFTFTISGVVVDENAEEGAEPVKAPDPTNGTSFTNKTGNTMTFADINFTEPGVYRYTITESGEVHGVHNDSEKVVTFTVVDNRNGGLTYTTKIGDTVVTNGETVVFTNKYRADSVNFEIPVVKTLSVANGQDGPKKSVNNAFTFELKGNDNAPMPAAGGEKVTINLVEGRVEAIDKAFGAITFDEPGTYTYTISETVSVEGVTKSADKQITIEVTDNTETGKLETAMKVDGNTATKVEIVNTYNANPDSITIDVNKSYVSEPAGLSKPSIDNKYKFVIKGSADAPKPPVEELPLVLTNDAALLTFGSIKFTKTGVFTYEISEVPVDGGVPNVSVDAAVKTVTVTVTDDGKGNLTASCTDLTNGKVTVSFTNTYEFGKITTSIPVKKIFNVPEGVTGPDITEKFSFTLVPVTKDAPMPEGAVTDENGVLSKTIDNPASNGGTADFGTMTFTEPGSYTYKVTESGTLPGVTNDEKWQEGKLVTIIVNDEQNGSLTLTNSVSGDKPLTFTNTYTVVPAEAVVDFEKVLEAEPKTLTPPSIANAYDFVLGVGENNPTDGFVLPNNPTKTLSGATGGTGSFEAITFTKEGKYYFTVTEQNTVAGVQNDPKPVKNVTIDVTDDGEGNLVAAVSYEGEATNAKFTNTYKVSSTSAEIKVKKTVDIGDFNGLDVSTIEDAFSFTLEAKNGAPMPEGAVGGKKVVYSNGSLISDLTFGSITFDVPNTYEYTVTESGKLPGVTNDTTVTHDVKVVVVDNHDGTLSATVYQGEEVDDVVEYTNTYNAEPTTITIPVVKTITAPAGVTAPSIANEYNFTISSSDSTAPLPMEGAVVVTKLVYDGVNSMEYPAITFTKPGTYVYTITEGLENAGVPGVSMDGNKTVTVEVVDDGEGALSIDWTKTSLKKGESVAFENKYDVNSANIILSVSKTLSVPTGLKGPDSIDKLFTFTLTPKDNAPMPDDKVLQKENNGTGSVSFDKITFTQPGTYTYTITESGSYDYITNDPDAEKTVVVTVVDNGGTLTATSNATNNTVNFVNTYKVTETTVSVPVEKTFELNGLTGPSDETLNGAFTFTLTGSNEEGVTGVVPMPADAELTYTKGAEMAFGPITYTTAGTWYYTITEEGHVDGITNDAENPKTFTVEVTDNKNGTLSAVVTGLTDNKATFTNTYNVGTDTLAIPVDKTVAYDKDVLSGPTEVADAFTFTITRHEETPDAPLPEECNVTVSSKGGSVSFGDITFDKPDTYKYWVSESGEVDGVTNDVANKKLVIVTVEDKGDGTLEATADYEGDANSVTFVNTYNAGPAKAVVPVKKTLSVQSGEAAGSIKNKFTFTLVATDDCPEGYDLSKVVPVTNPDDNGGTVNFAEISFTKPNTYTFAITESRTTEGEEDGISVATDAKYVTIKVIDNGAGELVVDTQNSNYQNTEFVNYYNVTGAFATISVTKVLETNGYTPDSIAGDFTFVLAAADDCPTEGYRLPDNTTVTNPTATGGTATFAAIQFSKADTYKFTVTETVTANAEVGGISNDPALVKTVTITVEDDGSGKLVVTTDEADRAVSFKNTYDVGETTATIYVKKDMDVLSGTAPADYTGKFTFTLAADANNPAGAFLPNDVTVTNADEAVAFDQIRFTEPGRFTFTITESVTDDAEVGGITNDVENPKTVIIEVSDNGDGSLTAEVQDYSQQNPVTFTNTYKVESAKVSFPVVKSIEAAGTLTAPDATGLFKFTLSAADGTPKPATVSYTNPDADGGAITFGDITFKKAGTYTYIITESVADGKNADGFSLAAAQTVTVTVTDNGYGKLVATASSTEENPLTFLNTYDVTNAEVNIPVKKTLKVPEGLTGPDSIAGKFTFTLEAVNGAPMPEGSADGKKSVTNPDATGGTEYFGKIDFTAPGTYEYAITESLTPGETADGISIDTTAQTVTIEIVDNGKGELVVDTEKSDYQSTEFINEYGVTKTTAKIPAKKTLEILSGNAPASIAGKFTFTLAATSNPNNGAELPSILEVTNPDANGGAITFGDITFKKAGTYIFTITESVTLTEEEKANNVTDKTVPGVSVDGEPKQVTIEVVDNKNGTLTATVQTYTSQNPVTFTNTYSVGSAKIDIPVQKILDEKDLKPASIAGKFTFTMKAVSPADAPLPADSSIVYEGENDGSVSFNGIEYTKAGLYIYEVTETGSADGVTNDPVANKRFAVKVVDNGDGTMSAVRTDEGLVAGDGYGIVAASETVTFTNTYDVASISKNIPAQKTLSVPTGLTGPADITGKFTFTLAANADNPAGATLPAVLTAKNEGAKGGAITFGDITFTKPGIFTFTVTETVTPDAEGNTTVPGITNDPEATKTVVFTVTDNGDGTMKVTSTVSEQAPVVFTNSYNVGPVTASFPVEKLLVVDQNVTAPDIAGAFTFEIKAVDGAPMPDTISYTNPDADGGVVTFGDMTYTMPGTYKYTVTETGSFSGVINDTVATKEVTVEVKDNGDGKLVATASATTAAPLTFTNTYEVVNINVQKVWNDENNRDGLRPASIQVQLMADGQPVGEAVKLDDSNSWKHAWNEVPRYSTSAVDSPITYTVKEIVDDATLSKYDVAVDYVWDAESNGTVTITNTHELETVEITGSKTWVDLNNKYLKRPDSVTIRLLADGVEIDSRKVTEADNWSWTFTKLPKYKAGEVGKAITYTVKEDVVTGYITTVDDFNVTNTMNLVEFIKLDEQTGKRLPGASFALYEGTAATYDPSKPVETWVSTSETKILAGLKVGQTYTIVETAAPSGYAMMAPFQFTVELTDIPGTYRSFSMSNCHVYRFRKLDSATGALVEGAHMAVTDANNNVIISWYSSNDNDGWYEIADSKLYAGVQYKLAELDAPWGYEMAEPIPFSIDETDGKLIINGSKSMSLDLVMYDEPWPEVTPTPEPTETSFTVTKRWEDKDNVLGLRPNNITVHLYRKLRTDAEYPTVPFMTVNMMSNGKDVWKFTFNDLPRRSPDGILYDYSIREEEVEGYVVSYLNNGRTIVNTIPEEDYPPTPTPTLPYVTPTPTRMPRIPAGVQFVDGEWMYIDEYGIPLGGIPLTGDNTNFVLWGMAIGMPLLVAALAAVEIRRRKKLLVAAEQDEEVDEEA